MPKLKINFEWFRDEDGYRVVGAHDQPNRSKIVRKGGPLRSVRPLEFHGHLFQQFADLPGTEESCLEFVCHFGFLGVSAGERGDDRRFGFLGVSAGGRGDDRRERPIYDPPEGEYLFQWWAAITDLRVQLEGWRSFGSGLPPGFVERLKPAEMIARLQERGPGERPALSLQPKSLLGAIHIQFFEFVASGKDLRACEQCGKWFETGASARRAVARFCSDDCRTKFHNRRRSLGGKP